MKQKFEIKWEDDDDILGKDGTTPEKESQEFANLLAETRTKEKDSDKKRGLRPGDKVSGVIIRIPQSSKEVLIEIDRKTTATIDRKQLEDEEQNLKHKEGETITAYVLTSKNGEIELSMSLGAKQSREQGLETAYSQEMPVRAKIMAVNKGGYELSVMGKKAFCPLSQLSNRFIDNPLDYVGKEFDFLIKQFSSHNIVLSRAELLNQSARVYARQLQEKIARNEECLVQGSIIAFKEFGAIVDLGQGLDGMLHKKEAGYGFNDKLEEIFRLGEKLELKVLGVEFREEHKAPRVSLSLKALARDPWLDIEQKYKVGASYPGEVVRLQEFGAFVQLEPGIQGLIHISELSWTKRVHHPKEVLSQGERVEVRVLAVDTAKQRISLSLKHVEEDPWLKVRSELHIGKALTATVVELKAQGAVVTVLGELEGFIPQRQLRELFKESYRKKASPKQELEVLIAGIDDDRRAIALTLAGLKTTDEDQENFLDYQKQREAQAEPKAEAPKIGSFGALLQSKLKR